MKICRFLLLTVAMTALWFVCRSTVEYTVVFDLNGGERIAGETVQSVRIWKDAVPPEVENGRLELSWDGVYENIKGDTTIVAQWEKVPLTPEKMEKYLSTRVVSVYAREDSGLLRQGAGFFLDDKGSICTAFGLVADVSEITVELADGTICPVELVVDYNPVYDLAVLRIPENQSPYLELVTPAGTEETVYSWDVTEGAVKQADVLSDVNLGVMPCVAVSDSLGLPGTPVTDSYGDVIGLVHSVEGREKHILLIPELLSAMTMDRDKTPEEFRRWYTTEQARSYSAWDGEQFVPTMLRTYQFVTGQECAYSRWGHERYEGYYIRFDRYLYEYSQLHHEEYVAYLEQSGYLLQSTEDSADGWLSTYYNEKEQLRAHLLQHADGKYLEIYMTAE